MRLKKVSIYETLKNYHREEIKPTFNLIKPKIKPNFTFKDSAFFP